MTRLFRSSKGKAPEQGTVPDPETLFADLARSRDGVPYSNDDRKRDFRRLFLDTEAGKRVLYELFAWSHMFASTFVPGDAYATHWREGGRDIGLRILTVLDTARPGRVGAGSDEGA